MKTIEITDIYNAVVKKFGDVDNSTLCELYKNLYKEKLTPTDEEGVYEATPVREKLMFEYKGRTVPETHFMRLISDELKDRKQAFEAYVKAYENLTGEAMPDELRKKKVGLFGTNFRSAMAGGVEDLVR